MVHPIQVAFAGERLKELEETARVCGASHLRTLFLVALPLSRNAILAGLLLELERASGEVGITMMLGGNLDDRTNTLSLEILNCVSRGDFDAATALCVLLVGFATVVSELLLIVQAKTVF